MKEKDNIVLVGDVHGEYGKLRYDINRLHQDAHIIHVGDLISYEKKDLLKARNFGNKSLEELTDYMSQYDLNFGTNIKDWNLIRLQLV